LSISFFDRFRLNLIIFEAFGAKPSHRSDGGLVVTGRLPSSAFELRRISEDSRDRSHNHPQRGWDMDSDEGGDVTLHGGMTSRAKRISVVGKGSKAQQKRYGNKHKKWKL
jgi:hypothetical protein